MSVVGCVVFYNIVLYCIYCIVLYCIALSCIVAHCHRVQTHLQLVIMMMMMMMMMIIIIIIYSRQISANKFPAYISTHSLSRFQSLDNDPSTLCYIQ